MGTGLKIAGFVLLIAGLLFIAPMIFIWCVNTLSEAGGANFYISHTAFNYFVALILMVIVNGSKG